MKRKRCPRCDDIGFFDRYRVVDGKIEPYLEPCKCVLAPVRKPKPVTFWSAFHDGKMHVQPPLSKDHGMPALYRTKKEAEKETGGVAEIRRVLVVEARNR